MNREENEKKVGTIDSLEQGVTTYIQNSKDLPTAFFKPIEEVQKEQTELIENYNKKEEEVLEKNVPDLRDEVRALEKKLNAKKFYIAPMYVLVLVVCINILWFLGVQFLIVPKYENYIKESKEIKENYDYLKRTIDAIVGD